MTSNLPRHDEKGWGRPQTRRVSGVLSSLNTKPSLPKPWVFACHFYQPSHSGSKPKYIPNAKQNISLMGKGTKLS
jgi:hypothetical protein